MKWKLQIASRRECLCLYMYVIHLFRKFSISQPIHAPMGSSLQWPWAVNLWWDIMSSCTESDSFLFSSCLLFDYDYFIRSKQPLVMHKCAEWQHTRQENDSDVFAIFSSCIVLQILFLPNKSQALTFLCLMVGDGAYRAKKKKVKGKKGKSRHL